MSVFSPFERPTENGFDSIRIKLPSIFIISKWIEYYNIKNINDVKYYC